MLHGHTVVWLFAHGCLVDPTAEQYERIDLYAEGAVIAVTGQASGGIQAADETAGVIGVDAERG